MFLPKFHVFYIIIIRKRNIFPVLECIIYNIVYLLKRIFSKKFKIIRMQTCDAF